jgi:hypothetical protein
VTTLVFWVAVLSKRSSDSKHFERRACFYFRGFRNSRRMDSSSRSTQNLKMKVIYSFETSGISNHATECNNKADLNLQSGRYQGSMTFDSGCAKSGFPDLAPEAVKFFNAVSCAKNVCH